MKNQRITISKYKLKVLALFSTITIIVIYIAINFLQPSNAYMGMRPIVFNSISYAALISFLLIWFTTFPKQNISPFDIFIGIYLIIIYPWFIIFFNISGNVTFEKFIILFLIQTIPILFFKNVSIGFDRIFNVISKTKKINISIGETEIVISVFLFIIAIISYKIQGISFSFLDSYIRRLAGREQITGILSYLLPSSLNSLAPILAFLGVYKKKYRFFFIALFFSVCGFGFIGTKSPILYSLLLGFLGLLFRKNENKLFLGISLSCLLIVSFALIEYFLFNYSLLSEILIRRAFLLPPQIQGYYIDYFFNTSTLENWIFGFENKSLITFKIGELYFNNAATNANTNVFLYEIGRNGVLGYILCIIFLILFYSFLNFKYRSTNNKVWLAISFIYSLTIIEQSYSTAFFTSGMALTVFILMITKSSDTTEVNSVS